MTEHKQFNVYFKSRSNPLPVGTLSVSDIAAARPTCYFVYDQAWLDSGFALGRDLPLIPKVFETNPRNSLFGFMQDITPGIGARKLHKFVSKKDFTNIELLAHSQEVLRPGALGIYESFQPALQAKQIGPVALDLERLMMGHINFSNIDNLYSALSALPGERFKLGFTASKNRNVISKFTLPDPDRNLVHWEAVGLSLAKRIGLKTVSAELTSYRGMDALMSTRFDRDDEGHPLAFASAQALLGAAPDSFHSYLEVADILNEDGSAPTQDLEELWKRMIFNMAVGNVNDRLDNIGFIREDNGWRLAPIYSVTPTPTPLNRRHHATGVTHDCDAPDLVKAVEVARYFGLKTRKAQELAHEITAFCAQNWEKVASDLQCDPIEMDTMSTAFAKLQR